MFGYGGCFSGWYVGVEKELCEFFKIFEGVEVFFIIMFGKFVGSYGFVWCCLI